MCPNSSPPGQRSKTGRLALALLAGTAVLAAICVLLAGPREPQCRGHPLSYWLEHYLTGGTDEDRVEAMRAEAAIREIGTDALLCLLEWMRCEPSPARTNFVKFMVGLRKSRFGRWVPRALTEIKAAPPTQIGFFVFGPRAAPAIPELQRIANDAAHKRPAFLAMMALMEIGPAAAPAMMTRLVNTNFYMPPEAALSIYLRTRT